MKELKENLIDERDPHLTHGDRAPCIQVRRLLSGLPDRLRAHRWFVILQVGLDESGHGQKGPHEAFVFAGLVGPVAAVEIFAHAWDEILSIPPAMSAKDLKKEIRSRRPDARVLELAKIIEPCEMAGVHFKIGQDDYVRMSKELGRLASARSYKPPDDPTAYLFDDNPYFFAFISVLLNLIEPIRNEPNFKLEVIYDENMQERKRLERGYETFREFARELDPELLDKLAKDPVPRNDEEFSLLQAADMLAWHAHRAHVLESAGKVHESDIWDVLRHLPFFVNDQWRMNDLLALIAGKPRPQ